MQKTIEVVYENGVFKPLEPVEIKEGTDTDTVKGRSVKEILQVDPNNSIKRGYGTI